ncbi:MAG: indole-3-glycerol phosphate synthase [Chloroflexi bacterium RBG_13_52_14]|nr:MAG: indole-3-glycerol phosphate synthase [Chloroflexi bacterium RBG_13_52_14]
MFLESIVVEKLIEIQERQEKMPLSELEVVIREKTPPLDFGDALVGNNIRLIAEVKKASPSKGLLCTDLNPASLASIYARCGAAAISVLTETRHFQGSLENLAVVRNQVPGIPLLRKDFIVKPYQVFESRAWGADALLLIVSILDDKELKELIALTHTLRMQCLIEVHNEIELERALTCQAKIIGINNRNLNTMTADIEVTARLRPHIPADRIVVSESGIKERSDIQKLRKLGVNAALIGEALVTTADIPAKIKELF